MLAERLQKALDARGLTLGKASLKAQVHERTARRWLKGEHDAGIGQLAPLAEYLGVSLDYLAGRTPDMEGRSADVVVDAGGPKVILVEVKVAEDAGVDDEYVAMVLGAMLGRKDDLDRLMRRAREALPRRAAARGAAAREDAPDEGVALAEGILRAQEAGDAAGAARQDADTLRSQDRLGR